MGEATPPVVDKPPTDSVEFITMAGHAQPIAIRSITEGAGEIIVPYLEWRREETANYRGPLSLLLDNRLGYDCPSDMTPLQEEALVEFVANCIAVGAGYASIYYTKRKMPFRG